MSEGLPQGWATTTLDEISRIITDGTHQTPKYVEEGIPFISTANLQPFSFGFNYATYRRFISKEEYEQLTRTCKPERGDILVSKCGTIGRVKEVDVDYEFSIFVGLALLKLHHGVFVPKLAEFWLNSPKVTRQFGELSPGSTRRTLTLKGIKVVEIPVPPFAEQCRIVAKLEKLLEKVDACEKRLEKIPLLLKRFRQSVLAAACSGRLTADWRQQNPVMAKSKGIQHGVDDIPESWQWLLIKELALPVNGAIQSGPFGSNLLHSEFQASGVLAVGIDNVLDGEFSIGKQHRISQTKYESLKKYTARPLDVLITVMATVGRCCVIPLDVEKAIITKHVYRITCNQNLINPYFLMHCLRGSTAVADQINAAIQGVTRPGINGGILKALLIPVPPLPEQQEIVRRVEELFVLADQLEARYKKAKAYTGKLTQSILAKAFRGELVPQDPNDEPASELLKGIAEGRKSIECERKAKKRRNETKHRATSKR
jgi:type I restriction enzyme S subunit